MLRRSLILSGVVLFCAGCGSQQAPHSAASEPSASAGADRQGVVPGFNLAEVQDFAVRKIAASGEPVANEEEPIDGVFDWSLNERGELAVMVERRPDNSFISADLFLVSQDRSVCLMRQRHDGPHGERHVRNFVLVGLNEQGVALILVRASDDSTSEPKLLLVDEPDVRPVPGSERLREAFGVAPFTGRYVAFVSQPSGAHGRPEILMSDGAQTRVCIAAHDDPFDSHRQFHDVGQLHGLNVRGQLLLEASVGRNDHRPIAKERLCLYTLPSPAGDGNGIARGEVRELARQGARLPGTDLAISSDDVDCWSGALLSDRGDVAMFATTEWQGDVEWSRALCVLRPENREWQVVLRPNQSLPPSQHPLRSISHFTINGQGQIACVVEAVDPDTYDMSSQLLRIEPNGQLTVLATRGSRLAADAFIDTLSAPQIIQDGKVVFQVQLRSEPFEPAEAAIAVADDREQRLMVRESELPHILPGFQRPRFGHFRAIGSGQIGLLVEGDSFEQALLLVTPEFSNSKLPRE